MTATTITEWLTDRAESYWQDSRILAEMGDEPMAVAYRTVAHELRKCATEAQR